MGLKFFRIGLGVVISAVLSSSAMAEKLIVGAAAAVVRQVEGIYGPEVRQLSMSDNVFYDEVISTRADSASKIKFPDDTLLTVGPNSKVTIDAFVYDPNSKDSKMVVNATLGVARFVTGKMGSAAYQIKTPTTTIGVRGTVLTVTVEEDGTTSANVENGAIFVQGQTGEPVEVGEGMSTTAEPGEPASEPAPADADVEADVAEMDVTLMLDGGDEGGNDAVDEGELQELVVEVEQTRSAGCGC
jgi:hypothetical protein